MSNRSKQDAFEELVSSEETLHVMVKMSSSPHSSTFADHMESVSEKDLTIDEIKQGTVEDPSEANSKIDIIKRAVRMRTKVPKELLDDKELPDDARLLGAEYNAIVEDMKDDVKERRRSVLNEVSLSFLANGLLSLDSSQTQI